MALERKSSDWDDHDHHDHWQLVGQKISVSKFAHFSAQSYKTFFVGEMTNSLFWSMNLHKNVKTMLFGCKSIL